MVLILGSVTYNVSHGVLSKYFDPNDMGFIFNANEQYIYTEIKRQEYEPRNAKLQRWEYTFTSNYSAIYNPSSFSNYRMGINNFYLWKSRNAVGGSVDYFPWSRRDYFEPRTFDFKTFVSHPSSFKIGGFFSSDYRKPLALDVRVQYSVFQIKDRRNYGLTFSPRFRFSDKFSIFPSVVVSYNQAEPGYVNKSFVDFTSLGLVSKDVMIGVRDRFVVENTFNIRWIFNHNLGVNTRIRHYYDNVQQRYFGKLNGAGNPDKIEFNGKDDNGQFVFDRNINIFNVDLQLNWRFLPGSDMVFVWKNQIFSSGFREDVAYFYNLSNLINEPQNNSLSIRFLFFVDYLYLDYMKKPKKRDI